MKLRIAAFKPFACIAAVIYIFVLAYGLIGFASAESGEYGEYGSKEKAERVKEIISSQLSEEEREMLGDESLYYGEPYAWFGDDFDIADYTLIRVLNYSRDDCGKPLEELAKKDFKV